MARRQRPEITDYPATAAAPSASTDAMRRRSMATGSSLAQIGSTAGRALAEADAQATDIPTGFGEFATSATFGQGMGQGLYDPDWHSENTWRNWTPQEQYRVQTQLAAAGYIGEDDVFRPGDMRSTREAFRDLLGDANDLGVTWQEALQAFTINEQMPSSGGGGGGRQMPTYTAPNRNDLQAAIKRGLYSQFGTFDNAVDVESLVDQYLASHRANFDAQVGLSMSGGGGEVEDVESLEGFVERQAREVDPMGVESRDFLDRANQFFSMLGGVV